MINNIARIGAVLLVLTCAVTADPILADDLGSDGGLEFSDTREPVEIEPTETHVRVRFGYAIRVDVPAPSEDWPDDPGAVDLPVVLDPAPLQPLFDLGGAGLDTTPYYPMNETVDLTPNPEPGSLLLAGAGLMALYLLRRRRQQG